MFPPFTLLLVPYICSQILTLTRIFVSAIAGSIKWRYNNWNMWNNVRCAHRMFKAFILIVWNQSHLTFIALATALGGRNSSQGNSRRQHHQALKVQTTAIVTTTVEYPPSIIGKAFGRVVLNSLQMLWEGVFPWGTVRVQNRKVNNRHDLFTEEAVGKMSCAEKTLLLPLLTWPRPSTQSSGRAYPISYRRLDAPTSSKGWQRFPWRNRPVRRLNLSPLPNQERSETGLCTCSHTSQHLFLLLVLSYAFSHSVDGVYLHSRSDVNLLNLARLQVKTKVRKVLISEMVFANDAVLTAHTKGASKRFISSFAHACCEFGLIISPKKTRILGRDVSSSRWWRTSLT